MAAPTPPPRRPPIGSLRPGSSEVSPLLSSSWNALTRLGEVFIVVIDTSVVASEVIKTVRNQLPSPLLLAMQTGLVRGFMAHHTWAEVPRVLAKRAAAEKVDLVAAESLWWHSYVRVVRFVPAGDLPAADPDLERALGGRDATDVPTLKVASLIAPVVVLAADRDLKDIGLAYERWWEVPEAIRKVVLGSESAEFASRVLFGAAHGTVAALRGLARAVQRPPVAIAVTALLLLATLSHRHWYPHLKGWIDDARPGIRQAAGKVGHAVYGLFEQYLAALSIWASAQRGRPDRTLTHRVARIVATSPKPRTRTEIARQLHDQVARYGRRRVMAELERILRRHQAFWEVSPGRWQFGKADAHFAGRGLPTARFPDPATQYPALQAPGKARHERNARNVGAESP